MSIEPRSLDTAEAPAGAIATGVAAGIAAGILLAAVQVLGALASGAGPLEPFRYFASIALGEGALGTAAAPTVFTLGLLVHLVLSATYGAIYAFIVRGLADSLRIGLGGRLALGAAYGALIWVVNLQLVGRFVYPWFLERPPAVHLALHVLFFGVPLGMAFDLRHRRAERFAAARATAHR